MLAMWDVLKNVYRILTKEGNPKQSHAQCKVFVVQKERKQAVGDTTRQLAGAMMRRLYLPSIIQETWGTKDTSKEWHD